LGQNELRMKGVTPLHLREIPMTEKITKKDAVRQAMAALGNDAMPAAIQGWVKKKLGIEMTAGHVSVTKSELLRAPKKEKATAKTKVQPAPARPIPATVNGNSIRLEDIIALKGLVDRVGADHMRTLIEVVAGR
jgi:hypothetical protein